MCPASWQNKGFPIMDCQTARPDTLILPLSKTDVFFKSPEWEELTISPMLPELYRHNIIPMKNMLKIILLTTCFSEN